MTELKMKIFRPKMVEISNFELQKSYIPQKKAENVYKTDSARKKGIFLQKKGFFSIFLIFRGPPKIFGVQFSKNFKKNSKFSKKFQKISKKFQNFGKLLKFFKNLEKFSKNFQKYPKSPKMNFKYSFSKFRTEGAAKKSNKSPLPKNTHILASSALKVLLRSQKNQKI